MNVDKLTLDLLRIIMIEELDVDEDTVTIYNQKFNLPPTKGMLINIEYKGAPKVISSRNKMINDAYGDPYENQDVNMLEDICICIYSYDLTALQRKEEVIQALHSIYSQQIQEANGFKIFRNANIIPINEIEGAARLYRFDIEVKVFSWYNKVKVAEFLNSYQVEVRVNDGQPDQDVVFTIPLPEYLLDPDGKILVSSDGKPLVDGDPLL